MLDPFPVAPPEALVKLVQPVTEFLSVPSLVLHAHEALFALALYFFIGSVVSPILSARLCPQIYNKFNKRTQINWNVHVVSFIQSTLVTVLALYTIYADNDRKELREWSAWEGRIWEYTGMGGLALSFALGYFIWDFVMCAYYVKIFGVGMLAHAISALTVFSFGYRPFVVFYAPVFLMYEASSPFLNIHWFCDKLELTGSSIQAINGAFLVGTFACCRLIWGNYSSVRVFMDIYSAIRYGRTELSSLDVGAPQGFTVAELLAIAQDEQGQRHAFVGQKHIPIWLGLTYLASNLTLNSLNVYWFGKMVQTIRTRFDPPWGTKGVGPAVIHWEPQPKAKKAAKALADAITPSEKTGSVAAGRKKAEEVLNAPVVTSEAIKTQRAELPGGRSNIEVSEQRTLRTRRKA